MRFCFARRCADQLWVSGTEELKRATPAIRKCWQRTIDVEVKGFFVQAMRTRCGSCNTAAKTVRLNEINLVHHLLELTHNARFT